MQRKPLEYKIQHHQSTDSTLCKKPHLNRKENKNANPIISRQNDHLTQPCPSEEKANKQTKTQHKSHPIRSLHKPLDQPWRAETKSKKEFNLEAWEKETSNMIIKIIIIIMEKADKYYTNKGTNQKHRSPNQ